MKKIVYVPTAMMKKFTPIYHLSEKAKAKLQIDVPFYYPINVWFADVLKEGDEINICFIELYEDESDVLRERCKKNEELFKEELALLNEKIKATIIYSPVVSTKFSESKDIFGSRFVDLYKELEKNCKIYVDMTFGAKTMTLILFNLLSFAEKFFHADIKNIVYGRTVFNDQGEPTGGTVCDVTSLFRLTSLTNFIQADTPEEAKNKMSLFFGV